MRFSGNNYPTILLIKHIISTPNCSRGFKYYPRTPRNIVQCIVIMKAIHAFVYV